MEVGDRITYKYLSTDDKNEYISVIQDTAELRNYKRMIENKAGLCSIEVLKIERPKWEIVEEKKELLTDEEREFLQSVLKFMNKEIKCITKKLKYNELELIFSEEEDGSGSGYWYYIKNSYFKNLEEREYTLKELRIGGINGRN